MAKGITRRDEDYSRWYQDIVLKAQLADYAPVKGCMVMVEPGMRIESVEEYPKLPDVPQEKIRFVGNTSLAGAVLAAGDREDYGKLSEIAKGMTYFELSARPGFMEQFVSACFLPHTDVEKFPSVAMTAGI